MLTKFKLIINTKLYAIIFYLLFNKKIVKKLNLKGRILINYKY